MSRKDALDELLDELIADMLGSADELRATQEAVASLALELTPKPPPPALRERVIDSVGLGGRFEDFVTRVAEWVDVAAERAREYLDLIDRPEAWQAAPGGNLLIHLQPGARFEGALAGFIRVKEGVEFPLHRHLGEERVLILQGSYRDSDGSVHRRGDVAVKAAGSEHTFVPLPGPDLVFLVVLQGGVQFADYPDFVV